MGVIARKSGPNFVITSDRVIGELPNNRIPKRTSELFQVWNGDGWSTNMTDAKTFAASDGADEYIRVNFARVMK